MIKKHVFFFCPILFAAVLLSLLKENEAQGRESFRPPPFWGRPICETGWSKYIGNRCIIAPNAIGTWFEANSQCALFSGRLVHIKSKLDLDLIENFIKNVPSPLDIYLGLRWTGDEFKWEDSTVANFTNWAYGQPNNNSLDLDYKEIKQMSEQQKKELNQKVSCVAMLRNGTDTAKWNDVNCNLKLAFICEKDIPNFVPPPNWGRNVVFGNLMLTISLILVILFIVLILLGVLFVFMLQYRRRITKSQENPYTSAQFCNLATSYGPMAGRKMPKIPSEEQNAYESDEPPRYEINFLPATRHQSVSPDDKELIYETILEEDEEDRLLKQQTPAYNKVQQKSDIPEYLEIQPTSSKDYVNLYSPKINK